MPVNARTRPSSGNSSTRRTRGGIRNRRLEEYHQEAPSSPAGSTASSDLGGRSMSPHSLMMSMSSVHHGGHNFSSVSNNSNSSAGSPPTSPRDGKDSIHPPVSRTTRPPVISPASPSRSWDDDRPPSPRSWKLQPKQQQQPRIVAELGKTQPVAFRRVRSLPGSSYSAQERLREDDARSVDSAVTAPAPTSRLAHGTAAASASFNFERPPTPTNTSVVMSTSSLLDLAADEDEEKPYSRSSCVSPAICSTASSSPATSPTPSSLSKICHAVQQNGPRPSGLSLEEKALWDAIQTVRRQARHENSGLGVGGSVASCSVVGGGGGDSANNGSLLVTSNDGGDMTSWESRFVEIQQRAVSQQRDNSRSLQTIQRVLANVEAERDEAVSQLQSSVATATLHGQQSESNSACSSVATTADTGGFNSAETKEAMQRDLRSMSEQILCLEKELLRTAADAEVKAATSNGHGFLQDSEASMQQLEKEKALLMQELKWKDNDIERLEHQVADLKIRYGDNDSDASLDNTVASSPLPDLRIQDIKKDLEDKSNALENAKMIIASLENASGSLAADLRQKLRNREDELTRAQQEAAQAKNRLDTLATELRDLQNTKAAEQKPRLNSEAEQVRRLQLSSRLEANLADIRAAAVILESTQDATAVSNLSQLLTDSASALKEGIDVIENGVADERRGPMALHRELEEKKKIVKRLEEDLWQQRHDASRLKRSTDEAQRRREEEVNGLHVEIKILQQQCNTNMEVLTRKERELAVLRDSLHVEDDDVGYISEDEPDEEDHVSVNDPNTTRLLSADYGPTQAEALATLLAHGGNRSFDSGCAAAPSSYERQQIETLKADLIKARADYEKSHRARKLEKESLSNAKMIISSLERANKSMMEDLRARLQDSNTAIASLLEKSMESEKTCSMLRAELEALKRADGQPHHEDEFALTIPAPPAPLLLTETID